MLQGGISIELAQKGLKGQKQRILALFRLFWAILALQGGE